MKKLLIHVHEERPYACTSDEFPSCNELPTVEVMPVADHEAALAKVTKERDEWSDTFTKMQEAYWIHHNQLAKAREEALEEAAKVSDGYPTLIKAADPLAVEGWGVGPLEVISAAVGRKIRALKSLPPAPEAGDSIADREMRAKPNGRLQ
jgi:hypothetical protein